MRTRCGSPRWRSSAPSSLPWARNTGRADHVGGIAAGPRSALPEPVLQVDDGLRRGLRERPGLPGRPDGLLVYPDVEGIWPRPGRSQSRSVFSADPAVLSRVLIGVKSLSFQARRATKEYMLP